MRCPVVETSSGESLRPNGQQVTYAWSASIRMDILRFFIWGKENRIGTDPSSKTSTCVDEGGFVGNHMMHVVVTLAVWLFANAKLVRQGRYSTVIPYHEASAANASKARREPIARVQPRSSTT